MADDDGFDWGMAFQRAYRAAYAVLRDASLAADAAQQACLKALVNLDSFQGRGSFPSWVRSIAFRLALDMKRLPIHQSLDPETFAAGDDPERGVDNRQAADALQRCLEKLTERQRAIFFAKNVDGMKGAEIAAEMKIQEGTVWATLHQAAANLRQCLSLQGIDRGQLH